MILRSFSHRIAAWCANLAIFVASSMATMTGHAQTPPTRGPAKEIVPTRVALDRFLTLKQFYVRAGDRCEEFQVQQKTARHFRRGPLGTVVTEIRGEDFRRIGPVEKIRSQIDELACASCFLAQEGDGDRPLWQNCSPKPSALWFESKGDCESLRSETGVLVSHCALNHLTDEGVRRDDQADALAQGEAVRALRDAERESVNRMVQFKRGIALAKAVYQQTTDGCVRWQVRRDPGDLSGWLFHDEEAPAHRVEIRFAAHIHSFDMTGPLVTVFPSLSAEAPVGIEARSCRWKTTLAEVSSTRLRFTDQTWYLSKQACLAVPQPAPPVFGPNCQ